jgi:hypothetical protein
METCRRTGREWSLARDRDLQTFVAARAAR